MRLLFLLLLSTAAFSQRFELLQGNFNNCKGISEYAIVFNYDTLTVHGFDTEEAYLNEKMAKREDKGTDIEFKTLWYEDRTTKYEPSFINYFNDRFSKNEIQLSNQKSCKYTMKVHTKWIYPGYFAEPAKISAIITIYETQNPKHVLVELIFEKVIGIEKDQFNGNQGLRIASAYEKLAKNLSIQMKRFL